MKRKDGEPKRKARRTLPEFHWTFRDHPITADDRHPCCRGVRTDGNHTVLSLFAGCGGLDLGFLGGFTYLKQKYSALPFDTIDAIDNSEDAIKTYQLNVGEHGRLGDLTEINPAVLPSAEVLLAGFPCQDFSSSGSKVGLNSKRGQLYRVLVEYMAIHKPLIVVGENVPHLARLKGGAYLKTILNEFEEVGYRLDVWELYCPDYGLPQSRRRLFLVGVRNDIKISPVRPAPSHLGQYVSIDEALKDLEEVNDEQVTNQSQYYVATRATSGGGQGDHTNQPGKVAYCIRANARGRIQFHYKIDRRLTVRECARLQSFPDEFVFPFSTQRNLALIGNAVPPIIAHKVATAINEFLISVKNDVHPTVILPRNQMYSRIQQLSLLPLT